MLNGATPLEERQIGETVYEPQDGTGSAQGAVWRSSVLSLSPTTGADDWRLQAWSAATGTVDTLGTARDLNGENDTPLLDGEIVPTENESNAFFASCVSAGLDDAPARVSKAGINAQNDHTTPFSE